MHLLFSLERLQADCTVCCAALIPLPGQAVHCCPLLLAEQLVGLGDEPTALSQGERGTLQRTQQKQQRYSPGLYRVLFNSSAAGSASRGPDYITNVCCMWLAW
jgi:hypothetical protein